MKLWFDNMPAKDVVDRLYILNKANPNGYANAAVQLENWAKFNAENLE